MIQFFESSKEKIGRRGRHGESIERKEKTETERTRN